MMRPEDAWDAVHLEGARQVEAFAAALAGQAGLPAEDAHRHADNAYLLVEFLANAYPKLPRDATERDLWLFLFDYCIAQGPFAGRTVTLTSQSSKLFFEFVGGRERVPELGYILEACGETDFFRQRLAAFEALARHADDPHTSQEALAEETQAWWRDLDEAMWRRGLSPDAALAGGEETWSPDMGPVEASVFDAVCTVLSRRARELRGRGAAGTEFDRELLAAQHTFMTRRNPGLGTTPLDAILRERDLLERHAAPGF